MVFCIYVKCGWGVGGVVLFGAFEVSRRKFSVVRGFCIGSWVG